MTTGHGLESGKRGAPVIMRVSAACIVEGGFEDFPWHISADLVGINGHDPTARDTGPRLTVSDLT